MLGIGIGLFYKKINRFVGSTMGGNLLQFVNTFVIWVVAQRLGLSAVLCLVAFAMTIARQIEPEGSTRMRVHSFAVWRAVIFVLNVFAFLLMGMQARTIVEHMKPERLEPAFAFAAIVVAVVIATRLAVVIGFNRLAAWWARLHGREEAATFAQGVLVGWSGMRGLVTLATAFALPQDFPQRDAVVLAAFSVVIATLVIQGLTMTPLIRFLKLDRRDEFDREIARARADLAGSALEKIAHVAGAEADNLRYAYTIERAAAAGTAKKSPFAKYRKLGLAAIGAERETLYKMRSEFRIGADGYLLLQEELDWRELTLLSDDDRQIEDS